MFQHGVFGDMVVFGFEAAPYFNMVSSRGLCYLRNILWSDLG